MRGGGGYGGAGGGTWYGGVRPVWERGGLWDVWALDGGRKPRHGPALPSLPLPIPSTVSAASPAIHLSYRAQNRHSVLVPEMRCSPPPRTQTSLLCNPDPRTPLADRYLSSPHQLASHQHTAHTHDENRKQERSKKSGERKLLRSRRAALDVFGSVDRGGNAQLWTVGAVLPLRPNLHPTSVVPHQRTINSPMEEVVS